MFETLKHFMHIYQLLQNMYILLLLCVFLFCISLHSLTFDSACIFLYIVCIVLLEGPHGRLACSAKCCHPH